ncbi:MAG: PQQ-dependent sugar dehydrogenase, partial [Pseudomonadota bacterium]|nr:PQQ-dependent sugar dehydrogenase [Pseudomonadota bacterium]
TYGHRNMQGAAVRPSDGALFTIEHGPKGGDELNLIQRGANYGWPVVSYGENYNGRRVGSGQHSAEGMAEPVYYWDPVIAPGGMAFYDGAMFPEWQGDLIIASLNPGGVVRLRLEADRVVSEERFLRGTRIRDIEIAPDGAILALVDAADGGVLRLTPDR